jgi:hypothetical protein
MRPGDDREDSQTHEGPDGRLIILPKVDRHCRSGTSLTGIADALNAGALPRRAAANGSPYKCSAYLAGFDRASLCGLGFDLLQRLDCSFQLRL